MQVRSGLKRINSFLLIFFLTFIFLLEGEDFQGTITPLDSTLYISQISNHIEDTKKSIVCILETFSTFSDADLSEFKKLLQNLILAHHSGIKIKIYLNHPGSTTQDNKNNSTVTTVQLLKKSGIPVFYMPPSYQIRYNEVIIDEKVLLEGGPPWIDPLPHKKNHYLFYKLTSEPFAKSRVKNIDNIFKHYTSKKSHPHLELGQFLYLDTSSFTSKHMRYFQKHHKNYLLDWYLWFCLKSEQKLNRWFPVQARAYVSRIYPSKITKLQGEAFFKKAMKQLKKINVIEVNTKEGGYLRVRLNRKEDSTSSFPLPIDFFEAQASKWMTIEEKLLYLFLLQHCYKNELISFHSKSTFKPLPKKIRRKLSQLFSNLEKKLVLEPSSAINHGSIPNDPKAAYPPTYRLLSLRNLKLLEKEILLLKRSYPPKLFGSALTLASQWNKEKDPDVIRNFIFFLKELPFLEIQKVINTSKNLPNYHPAKNFREVKKALLEKVQDQMNEY